MIHELVLTLECETFPFAGDAIFRLRIDGGVAADAYGLPADTPAGEALAVLLYRAGIEGGAAALHRPPGGA